MIYLSATTVQAALVLVVGMIDSTIISAFLAGAFLVANTALTIWLTQRGDRERRREEREDAREIAHEQQR